MSVKFPRQQQQQTCRLSRPQFNSPTWLFCSCPPRYSAPQKHHKQGSGCAGDFRHRPYWCSGHGAFDLHSESYCFESLFLPTLLLSLFVAWEIFMDDRTYRGFREAVSYAKTEIAAQSIYAHALRKWLPAEFEKSSWLIYTCAQASSSIFSPV